MPYIKSISVIMKVVIDISLSCGKMIFTFDKEEYTMDEELWGL